MESIVMNNTMLDREVKTLKRLNRKATVITLNKQGKTVREIGEQTGYCRQTIYKIIKDYGKLKQYS